MALLLALAMVLAAPPSSPPRPSSAALRRAFEAGERALVEARGRHPGGAGVLVGAQGQVLTALRFVDEESVNVRLGSTVLGAKLLLRSPALRVAVLDMVGDGPYPAMAVQFEPPEAGAWVVGVAPGRAGAAQARLGRVLHVPDAVHPWLETSLTLPLGCPVLDAHGRLLGVVVEQRPGGSLAAPVPAVRAALETAVIR
jgi:hypothetical protein